MKKIILFIPILFLTINYAFGQDTSNLIPYLKGELFGFVDKNKKMKIKPKFTHAYPFGYVYKQCYFPDVALVQIDRTMFLVDEKGKLIKEDEFDKKLGSECDHSPPEINYMRKPFEYYIFEKDGKKGIRDENNNIILNPIYKNLDIFVSFEEHYTDRKYYYNPTFARASTEEQPFLIIRIDKYKVYENISPVTFGPSQGNYMIVAVYKDNKFVNNGLLVKDKLIRIDPKYYQINAYYEKQGLISVSKIIDDRPIDFYIDLKGNEYYEK